jgi:hypothetical protein
MHPMRRWSGVAAVVLALAVTAAPMAADAQNRRAVQRARLLFARGVHEYDQGHYRPALGFFTRAYELVPAPAVIYNIAQCHLSLGADADAARHFRLFLEQEPDAPNRAEVERKLREIDARLGQRRHRQREATLAEVRDEQQRIERTEHEEFRRTLRDEETVSTPEEHHGGGHVHIATWITLGAGLAVAGVGGLFALDAASKQSDLDDPGLDCHRAVQKCLDIVDSGDRSATLRTVLLAAGGAALAAGTVMLVLDVGSDDREDSSTARAHSWATLTPTLGPDVAMLEARGTW